MSTMRRFAKPAAFALPLLVAASQGALAYDPCQRALEDREAARDALNHYYATHCTWSYEPRNCRNSQWGYELERRMLSASQRAREACY